MRILQFKKRFCWVNSLEMFPGKVICIFVNNPFIIYEDKGCSQVLWGDWDNINILQLNIFISNKNWADTDVRIFKNNRR